MGYVALYRKYRPKVFSEVTGQEHVTKTLKNQVKNKKIAHAYLFNGPRGTGKTSVAKILSRAVNCLDNSNGDPCNECDICKGILDGSIMDVVEIDAASNNSVDNVRDIRDEIIYSPSKTNYKVYIIDEVHMLSTGAFNALLKTLEEPPSHVIFILATTEPHKLPATIISRCQRFDFKRISANDILERLKTVANDVDTKIDEKALELISRLADGGMRDALSLMDQSISLGKDKVTQDDILLMVGIVDGDVLFELSNAIHLKDIPKAIEIISKVSNDGKDINNFISRLIMHYRNLLVAKVVKSTENILNLTNDDTNKLVEYTNGMSQDEILQCITIMVDTLNEAKKTTYSKLLLEVAVIKLCTEKNPRVNESTNKNKGQASVQKNTVKEEVTDNKRIVNSCKVTNEKKNIDQSSKNEDYIGAIVDNWIKVLDDMKAKGFTPLKIQYLNDVTIKPLTENSILIYINYQEDIYSKMLTEKKLVSELEDSILKVTGKDIKIKFDSKKDEKEEVTDIDRFKEIIIQKGMQGLINEV